MMTATFFRSMPLKVVCHIVISFVVCFFFFFFLKGGDFLSFLRKKKEDLKTKQLVKFALDAAGGMAYLELKNCIHR